MKVGAWCGDLADSLYHGLFLAFLPSFAVEV